MEEVKPIVNTVRNAVPPIKLKPSVKFTVPVITEADLIDETEELKSQNYMADTQAVISVKDVVGSADGTVDIADVDDRDAITDSPNTSGPLLVAEQMPEFPGDVRAYLAGNIKYPYIALENNVSGTVYVSFVVGPDGSISNAKILRGFDKFCEEEALRVVMNMPPWNPGRQNGIPVYVQFHMPIKFQLQNTR